MKKPAPKKKAKKPKPEPKVGNNKDFYDEDAEKSNNDMGWDDKYDLDDDDDY